jgi:aryl-alcohol dehydrogenase-like predicted oxidoreductase
MRAVEASLKRLQTDRIELYQIHMQDIDTPEDETLRALDDLVTQGKILYVGASNYAAYRLVESLYTSDKHGWSKFVSLQAHYNLVTRSLEREHVPACLRFGLGILPWSPLAAGFLTGKYQRGQPAPEKTRLASKASRFFDYSSDRNWGVVEELVKIAAELEKTPAQVALAWLVQRPAVTSVIFGARSLEQLEANLSAATLVLDDQTMKRLNDVSAPHLDYPYDFLNRVQGRW